MRVTPLQAADRLRAAARDGQLAALAERFDVRLITLFGSTVDNAPDAGDVDVAMATEKGRTLDLLGILDALYHLTGSEDFDLLDLNHAGDVARQHALSYADPLYESREGEYAEEQIKAVMMRMDTDTGTP